MARYWCALHSFAMLAAVLLLLLNACTTLEPIPDVLDADAISGLVSQDLTQYVHWQSKVKIHPKYLD